jgi:hypothetical protein
LRSLTSAAMRFFESGTRGRDRLDLGPDTCHGSPRWPALTVPLPVLPRPHQSQVESQEIEAPAWPGRPRPAVAPAAQRAASDERARADQEPKRAVEAAAVRAPARPVAAVGRVRPEAGGLEGRARPADRPQQPAPDGQGTAPVAAAQTPDPTCRLAEQLEKARARIAELEAERERTAAVHRDLIRRARAAMRREVAS